MFSGFVSYTLAQNIMHRSTDYKYKQLSFVDFNELCGMQLDHEKMDPACFLPSMESMGSNVRI